MMERKIIVAVTIVVLFVLMVLSGCCGAGAGIGAIVDASTANYHWVARWEANTQRKGTNVSVRKAWGGTLTGTYLGVCYLTKEEYTTRYTATQELKRDEFTLPDLFDGVTISLKRQPQSFYGEFQGFNWLGINRELILIRMEGQPIPDTLNLREVESFQDRQGNYFRGVELKELIREKDIPVISAMVVLSGSDTLRVPFDEIDDIEWRAKKKKFALWGFLAGACVDVIFWQTGRY
jgi:hypothetical protein